jgi:tRNA(adenine34) deaminase
MAYSIIESQARAYDEIFMKQALEMALCAYKENEVPIGAVVISKEGEVIGKGYNRTEQEYSQSRHAEVGALEQAGRVLKDWRLTGCTLYVTIEPCMMCLGLIGLSRVSRVVYGAQSPLFGLTLDKEMLPNVYKHIKGITAGICEEEAQGLMERFFKEQRIAGEKLR